MLNKLAVPFLVLSLATFGCSSSDSKPDGGGGRGGSSGGSSGGSAGGSSGGSAGGSSGGSAGGSSGGSAGGSTGGSAGGSSGGSAGGSSGGSAGGATDGGNTDAPRTEGGGSTEAGGGDAGLAATAKAECPTRTATSPAFSAESFCALFMDQCSAYDTSATVMTMTTCVTAYTAWMADQKTCRSYHLCNAINGNSATSLMTHCPHAEGLATMGATTPGGPCM